MRGPRVDEVYQESKNAMTNIAGYVRKTDLVRSAAFSKAAGAEVFMKLENMQKTGAFKIRGALNACWKAKSQGDRIVVTSSAGNHGQGVAYAGSSLGLEAHVFMPEYASPNKIEATRSYGAVIHLRGDTYDDSYEFAREYATERKAKFIHAFDDLDVAAGQGTIGLELHEQAPKLDFLLVPVGGGGLISGLGSVMKRLSPATRIVGVQSSEYPAFYESFKRRELTEIKRGVTIADGISVKKPGELTFNIALEVIDDMITVTDDEIGKAMFMLLERSKMVAEPAGAASLAGAISGKLDLSGKRVGAIISGGNVNPLLLARVITQGLRKTGRLIRLTVTIPDRPGSLRTVLGCIASARANVVDLAHVRDEPNVPPSMATVQVTMEIQIGESFQQLTDCLSAQGFTFEIS